MISPKSDHKYKQKNQPKKQKLKDKSKRKEAIVKREKNHQQLTKLKSDG